MDPQSVMAMGRWERMQYITAMRIQELGEVRFNFQYGSLKQLTKQDMVAIAVDVLGMPKDQGATTA
jgi:hypothetical protein